MPEQDKIAEMYASGTVLNRYGFETWNRHLPYKLKNLRSAELDQVAGLSILDFGCGPGTFGIILGRKNTVIGLDIARQAVEQARDRAREFQANMSPIWGDGDHLCIRQSSLDICFSGWAIHHLPKVEGIIREFHTILKPNGLVVIIEPNEDSFGMRLARFVEDRFRGFVLQTGLDTPNRSKHTNKEYELALKNSGFKIVRMFTHYNGELPEVPKDMSFFERTILKSMILLRHLILWFSTNALGNGPEVFYIARKQ